MKPKVTLISQLSLSKQGVLSSNRVTIVAFPMEIAFGGPPQVVEKLTFFFKDKYDLTVITFGHVDPIFFKNIHDTVKVVNQKTFFNSLYRPVLKLNREVKKILRDSDIILIHGVYFPHILLISFIFGLNGKKFLMPHGVFEIYQQEKSVYRKRIFDSLLRITRFWSDTVIMVATESEMIGVRKKFTRSKILVVGLPVEVPVKYHLNEPKTLSIAKKIRLIHVGRIAHKKRIDLTLKAVAKLKNEGNDVEFTIVGGGNYRLLMKLKKLTSELNIGNQVKFVGEFSHPFIFEMLKQADILVLPSENENFAISVAEALLVGVPCITSNCVSLGSLIKEYDAGIVIDKLDAGLLANAILTVFKNYTFYSVNTFNLPDLFSPRKVLNRWEIAFETEG